MRLRAISKTHRVLVDMELKDEDPWDAIQNLTKVYHQKGCRIELIPEYNRPEYASQAAQTIEQQQLGSTEGSFRLVGA